MINKIKCLLGFHDWKDFEITLCTGYPKAKGDTEFPTKQVIIKKCSRCLMVNTREMRDK